ncbi:hypothetical protein BCR32DRAFT_299089, partial [Anaeromyces robustus]
AQKNVVIKKYFTYSALNSLYNDEEVCEILDCDLIKSVQGINRPIVENYNDYSSKVINFFSDFLDDKMTAKELLTNIDDITRIYFFSIKTPVGLIMFIILTTIFMIILLSIILLFIPELRKYYQFLSLDLWLAYTCGSLLVLAAEIGKFEELSELRCNVNHVMMIMGIAITFLTILYKLIINFPKKNKLSDWIKKHKHLYLLLGISYQGILSALLVILVPMNLKEIIINNGKNYYRCQYPAGASVLISQVQNISNLVYFICISVLIFFEWNMEETYQDIRSLTIVMCVDGVSWVLLTIINFVNIKNYILYYVHRIIFVLALTIMNHIYMFIIRVVLAKSEKPISEEAKLENKLFLLKDQTINTDILNTHTNSTYDDKAKYDSVRHSKFLNIHYTTKVI